MTYNCIRCNQEYKIILQEQEFYNKMGLPRPENCPFCRQKFREESRNQRKFYKYPCAKCGEEMVTTHDPKKKLIEYCLKCYADFRTNVDLTK